MNTSSVRYFDRAVPILIGILLLVRLIGMAEVPLLDTTEARYGEIGRKMAELNDWVTPWFDYGVPYWGKPPLSFWVTAISFKLFGVNEFAARLPHMAISLLVVGLVAWLAARRDRNAALPSVAVMSGSFLYFISAGAVMADIELTLGTTLAMVGFWLAVQAPAETRSNTWATSRPGFTGSLIFGGLIVGLLAKGPLALVMAGAPLFLWTAYNRRWLDVWHRVPWVRGVLLTLLIALPWYWIAEYHTPGFLEYFLVGEHWQRFITPGWGGDRYGNAHIFPIGSIWVFAIVDTLPWSLLLPLAAWRWRKEVVGSATSIRANADNIDVRTFGPSAVQSIDAEDQTRFIRSDERIWQGYLLIWAITPLLFFTAARNLVMTYVLPGIPAAAILGGGWLAHQQRKGREINRWLSIGLLLTLLTMCGLFVMNISQPDKMEHKSVKTLVASYNQAIATPSASDSPSSNPAQSSAPLIFLWFRPFSAQFYSHGRAVKVASVEECWERIGVGAAYVATFSGDAFMADAASNGAGALSGKAGALSTAGNAARVVTRIGHYGDYDLLFVAAR